MHGWLAGWLADMDLCKIDASGAERSTSLVTHRRLTHGSKARVKPGLIAVPVEADLESKVCFLV